MHASLCLLLPSLDYMKHDETKLNIREKKWGGTLRHGVTAMSLKTFIETIYVITR